MAQREFIMGLVAGAVVLAVGAMVWQSGAFGPDDDTSEATRVALRASIEAPKGQVPRALPDELRTEDCGFGLFAQRALQGTVAPQTVQVHDERSQVGRAVVEQLRQASGHKLQSDEAGDTDQADDGYDFKTPEAQLTRMLEATRCKRITGVVGLDAQRVLQSAALVGGMAKYRASKGDFRQAQGWAFGLWAFGQDLRAVAPVEHGALGTQVQGYAVLTVLYLLQDPAMTGDEAAEANLMARRLAQRSPSAAWSLGHVATARFHEAIDSSQARTLDEEQLIGASRSVVSFWTSVIRAANTPGMLVPDLTIEQPGTLAFARRAAGTDQALWVQAHRSLQADVMAVQALSKMRSAGVEPGLCEADLTLFPTMYDPITAAPATWDADLCGVVMGERTWSLRREQEQGNRMLDLSGD